MVPYIIRISSQKGGVGKTTIAVNLAVSLQIMGYRTLLVDADTTNPSVGFHLGMEGANVGMKDLIKKERKLKDVVSIHGSTGMHVICGTLNSQPFAINESNAKAIYNKIRDTNYSFVIVDTEPGYTTEYIQKVYDEALLITTPEMSAVGSIVRMAHTFDKLHIRHHMIINKFGRHKYELHPREIEETYGSKAISILPEDEIVPVSISEHIPAVVLSRKARFSVAMRELTEAYSAMSSEEPERENRQGIWARLFGFWRK